MQPNDCQLQCTGNREMIALAKQAGVDAEKIPAAPEALQIPNPCRSSVPKWRLGHLNRLSGGLKLC